MADRSFCGGRPWALLSPEGSYYELQGPTFFVGRHESAHLILKSRSVDKEHAVITAQPDQGIYCIHDLESLNGTFVNEKRVQRAVLGLKDTIRFGYICQDGKVLHKHKWVAIEEDRTFLDLLRYSTGDQFTKSRVIVVVCGEISMDHMVRVSIKDSVTVLEDKDKRMVSFLLEPENKLNLVLTNTFRVDLLPYQEDRPTLFDHNNNSPGARTTSHDYLQDTNVNTVLLTSNQCCKGPNETPNSSSDQAMSRLCHNCGSTTVESARLKTIVQGSKLYGQPSWWGWESSDEEFYTYPNCATVVTQAGTLAIPSQHSTILQQRIQRNKAKLGHSLKSGFTSKTSNEIAPQTLEGNRDLLKEDSYSGYPGLGSLSSSELQQLGFPVYNVPAFGAWETIPQGRFGEGPEEYDFEENEKLLRTSLSHHIPIMPDFGEIPEKPVSEKSSKTARRKHLTASSSFASETSDCDNDRSQPTPDYPRRVFGLTEVNMSKEDAQQRERRPKGVRVGKPKTTPVKVKTADPKPSTPRSVTETSRSRRIHEVASTRTSEDMTTPTKITRGVTRASSSGGSSVPSDTESRDSDPSHTRGVFTSTSDDSDGDREGRITSNREKRSSEDKRKKKTPLSPRERDKESGELSDKTHRPSSASSALPRANKTAMLRALNSREAVKYSTSTSASRLHSGRKPRYRHSTPAAMLNKDNSPVDPNSSLRLWSPSIKKSPKATSPSGKSKRPCSGDSSPRSSRTRDQLSSEYETQAAVDTIFESNVKTTYTLPEELQMNRNDARNKTFVLEEKTDQSTNSSKAETPDAPLISREGTIDLRRPKTFGEGEEPKSLLPFEGDLSVPGASHPPISAWMSLLDEERPVSPESLVSVPPAVSPSPPSTPRSSARNLLQDRSNCYSAPPQPRRQWDVTDKPVEDLMLSSVHAFTVELRLASESVLSKARNLYEFVSDETTESTTEKLRSSGKQENRSTVPEWKSSHAELAGVFRNLRRVEFNLRTMDQALSFLCSASGKEACKSQSRLNLPERLGKNPQSWNDFKLRARTFSWAEENKNKFPTGPPSDDEEVTSPQ